MDVFVDELGPSQEVVMFFKGSCAGVVLHKRGKNDNHICFQPLVEDDENWFLSKNGYSTCWFDDLMKQMEHARAWLQQYAERGDWGFSVK